MISEKKGWKKELARDFLALGSWVFFVLVLVRIFILPNKWAYINHLLIAGVFILLVDLFLRGNVDTYISRALVLAFYTSLYYENNPYSIFVSIACVGLILSSKYVGNSWMKIGYGVLLGLVGIGLRLVLG